MIVLPAEWGEAGGCSAFHSATFTYWVTCDFIAHGQGGGSPEGIYLERNEGDFPGVYCGWASYHAYERRL